MKGVQVRPTEASVSLSACAQVDENETYSYKIIPTTIIIIIVIGIISIWRLNGSADKFESA